MRFLGLVLVWLIASVAGGCKRDEPPSPDPDKIREELKQIEENLKKEHGIK